MPVRRFAAVGIACLAAAAAGSKLAQETEQLSQDLHHHERTLVADDGSFTAFGKQFRMSLQGVMDTVSSSYKHTAVMADGSKVVSDSARCHFTGVVEGDPDSFVTMSNCTDGATNRRRLMGSVKAHGMHLYMEPSAANDEYIVYHSDDVIEAGSCGSGDHEHGFDDLIHHHHDHHEHEHHAHSGHSGRSLLQNRNFGGFDGSFIPHTGSHIGDEVVVEIYVIHDQAATYSNTFSAESIIAQADTMYREGGFSPRIRLKLAGEESWVGGNQFHYSGKDSGSFLNTFANYKQTASSILPPHDILFFVTGEDISGNVKGAANIGKVCGRMSVGMMQVSRKLKTAATVFAHEIGHLLGAQHDGPGSQGLGGNQCPTSGFIMSPNLSGMGLPVDGECNTLWVGDGYCDVRCMKYSQDGGDCYGRTHDSAGNSLQPGLQDVKIGWSQCSVQQINAVMGRHPTCLTQVGNHHTLENEADMMGLGLFDNCNTLWVGDGYCDFRCVKYNNDGGDCDGKTTDSGGNPLSLGGKPRTHGSSSLYQRGTERYDYPDYPVPGTGSFPSSSYPSYPSYPSSTAPAYPSSSPSECNMAWVGDGFCDYRCAPYNNDGGDCAGKVYDDSGMPLTSTGSSYPEPTSTSASLLPKGSHRSHHGRGHRSHSSHHGHGGHSFGSFDSFGSRGYGSYGSSGSGWF